MSKFFDKLLNVLSLIIATLELLFSNFDLELKLIIFFVILSITFLVNYIYVSIKCNKLVKENNNLIVTNKGLITKLERTNETVKVKNLQLESYQNDSGGETINII